MCPVMLVPIDLSSPLPYTKQCESLASNSRSQREELCSSRSTMASRKKYS